MVQYQKSYIDALYECTFKKMGLAVLDTEERNVCFQQAVAEKGLVGLNVRFGLDKIKTTNYTKWAIGTEVSYLDWRSGKPGAFVSAHCVAAK
jgi:hypothetical protein